MYSWFKLTFFFGVGEGGGVTEKNYLYWGGGHGKNFVNGGGHATF